VDREPAQNRGEQDGEKVKKRLPIVVMERRPLIPRLVIAVASFVFMDLLVRFIESFMKR